MVTFQYSVAFDAPVWGSLTEYCHYVWYGTTRRVWLSDGKKIEYTFSSVDRIPACDGRMDGQTDKGTDI